jgi:hypothetical protein
VKVGTLIASTGGKKLVRCVETLRAMGPELEIHVTIATNTRTYRSLGRSDIPYTRTKLIAPTGFVNGSINAGIKWLESSGYDAALVLQDDLIFSPLPEHRGSLSQWFPREWHECSGLTFAHLECLTYTDDLRRAPDAWDREDFSSPELWKELMTYDGMHNGAPVYPSGRDWFIRYEGTDVVRPWNRLGPTGFLVPIKQWRAFGGFDEEFGVFFDHDYPAECFQRSLKPVYAVPNVPWLHLHNQSVNPWADQAIGLWGDNDGAFARKFGGVLTSVWCGDWTREWERRAGVRPFEEVKIAG